MGASGRLDEASLPEPDATLGQEQSIAVREGEGTGDPPDRSFAGRRMSAVDQAYRYGINLPCDWIIVTSMRETRLYYKGSRQQTYERFETVRLAADEALPRHLTGGW